MRFLLVLALIAACGAAKTDTTTSVANADDPSCPLLVPGTSLTVEDTTNGAALVFVTTGDPLAVRARAAALAEMHTKHDGPPKSLSMRFSPSSTATASEVESGARVEFTAKKPEDAAAVQSDLRMHAGHLTGGSCQM